MNAYETVGVITGALSVWLAARQNWLTWPIGIVNLAAFIVMFYRAQLYPDVLLHLVYFGLSIYGWAQWGNKKDKLPVTSDMPGPVAYLLMWLCTVLLGTLFASYTKTIYPFADSFVTCMSLLACYLMSKKIIESWCVYIVSDVVAILIYIDRGLNLTAGLYLLYLLLCIKGYQSWKQELKQSA